MLNRRCKEPSWTAIETFRRLYFAFNNADVEQKQALTTELPVEEWDRLINTDLHVIFLRLKQSSSDAQARRRMSHSEYVFGCGSGVTGFLAEAAHVTSKHGVIGLIKAAALDNAQPNIRINAVAPENIDTSMIQRFSDGTPEGRQSRLSQEPIGRMYYPQEIASAVIWLCSDAASFVTGHTMVVDGGQTIGWCRYIGFSDS